MFGVGIDTVIGSMLHIALFLKNPKESKPWHLNLVEK